jgi:hypothetical protein
MNARRWVVAVLGVAAGVIGSAAPVRAQATQFHQMSPFQTFYVRDALDVGALAPLVVDLSIFAPGSALSLTAGGQMRYCGGVCGVLTNAPYVGIFSRTSTVLGPSVANRVPDAVDPGPPWSVFTGPTLFERVATNIPFDFYLGGAPGTVRTITIPASARYLLLGVNDSFNSDNLVDDPASFGVTVSGTLAPSAVPEPATLGLVGAGLLAVGGASARRKYRIG